MSVATTLIAQLAVSNELINIEKNRVAAISELMVKTIITSYPLSTLIGNNSVYHQHSRGNDIAFPIALNKCNIDFYNFSLKPYSMNKGSELNDLYSTHVFNSQSSYVLYVSDTAFLAVELDPLQ